MPELPDVELYLHCLRPRVVGQPIERVTIRSPFVLRTFEPPIDAVEGRTVSAVRRLGKRVVLALDDDRVRAVRVAGLPRPRTVRSRASQIRAAQGQNRAGTKASAF